MDDDVRVFFPRWFGLFLRVQWSARNAPERNSLLSRIRIGCKCACTVRIRTVFSIQLACRKSKKKKRRSRRSSWHGVKACHVLKHVTCSKKKKKKKKKTPLKLLKLCTSHFTFFWTKSEDKTILVLGSIEARNFPCFATAILVSCVRVLTEALP